MNTPHYSNSHNLGIILPKIVVFSVQTLVYVPSLSSRLLLRNIPNFFDYYGSSPMCLSSRNRSNSKAFRHILPRVAPVCEGMHYHKTGVPWQMNNTFILLILSPYIFSKPCKYWLSNLYTRLFEIIFYLQEDAT